MEGDKDALLHQLQQQIADLQDDKFSLEMALATADAERQSELKTTRRLEDELRIAKREAKQVRQQQQPVTVTPASAPPPVDTIVVPSPEKKQAVTPASIHLPPPSHPSLARTLIRNATPQDPAVLVLLADHVSAPPEATLRALFEMNPLPLDCIGNALRLCPAVCRQLARLDKIQPDRRRRRVLKSQTNLDEMYNRLQEYPTTRPIPTRVAQDFVDRLWQPLTTLSDSQTVLQTVQCLLPYGIAIPDTWLEHFLQYWWQATAVLLQTAIRRRLLDPSQDTEPAIEPHDWCTKASREDLITWTIHALETWMKMPYVRIESVRRQIQATVLDLLETNPTHNLILACNVWMQFLLRHDNKLMLLRMPTTESTDEAWVRGPTGVGVVVHLLFRTVLSDEKDPHNTQNESIQSSLVQTLHDLMRTTDSFGWLVTDEYPEQFTGAASTLLVRGVPYSHLLKQQLDQLTMDLQQR